MNFKEMPRNINSVIIEISILGLVVGFIIGIIIGIWLFW